MNALMSQFANVSEVYIYQMERTRTGTTRRVKLFAVVAGQIEDLTHLISVRTKLRYDYSHHCISIQGAGVNPKDHLHPYIEEALGHAVNVRTL